MRLNIKRRKPQTRIKIEFLLQFIHLPEIHILYIYGIDVDYINAEIYCDWLSFWGGRTNL